MSNEKLKSSYLFLKELLEDNLLFALELKNL